MQNSLVFIRLCQFCEKNVSLRENDFIATISPSGKSNFFFICPRCEEVEKVDEKLLPEHLKARLIASAKQRENGNKIYIYTVILIFIGIAFFLFARTFAPHILDYFTLS